MDSQQSSNTLFEKMLEFYQNFAGNLLNGNRNQLFEKEFDRILDEEENKTQRLSFKRFTTEKKDEFAKNEDFLQNLYDEEEKKQNKNPNSLTSSWYKVLCNLKKTYSEENDNKIELARVKEIQHLLNSPKSIDYLTEKSKEFQVEEDVKNVNLEKIYQENYDKNIGNDSTNYPVVQHLIDIEQKQGWVGMDDKKWVHYALQTELFNVQEEEYCIEREVRDQLETTFGYLLHLINFLKGAYSSLDHMCSTPDHSFTAFQELLAVLEGAVCQDEFQCPDEEKRFGMYHWTTVLNTPQNMVHLEIEIGICPPSICNDVLIPYMIQCFIQKIMFLQHVHKHLCINIKIDTPQYVTRHTICIVQQFKKAKGICIAAELPKTLDLYDMEYEGENLKIFKQEHELHIDSGRIIPFHEDHMMLSHLSFLKSLPTEDNILSIMKNASIYQSYIDTIFISEFNFAYYLTIVNLQDRNYQEESKNAWKIYFTYVPYYLSFWNPKKDTQLFLQEAKHSRNIILPQKFYLDEPRRLFPFDINFEDVIRKAIINYRTLDYNNPGNLGLGLVAMMRRKQRRTQKEYTIDPKKEYTYYLNDVIPNKVLCKKLSIHNWNKVDFIRARMQVVVSTTIHQTFKMPTFFQYRKNLQKTDGKNKVYPFREYYNEYRTTHPDQKNYFEEYMTFWLKKIQLPIETWVECNETTQQTKGRIKY